MLICDVALGKCWKTEEHCYVSREGPPFGHGSVHGIRSTEKNETIFEVFDPVGCE